MIQVEVLLNNVTDFGNRFVAMIPKMLYIFRAITGAI